MSQRIVFNAPTPKQHAISHADRLTNASNGELGSILIDAARYYDTESPRTAALLREAGKRFKDGR